jgi:hypothetical protein
LWFSWPDSYLEREGLGQRLRTNWEIADSRLHLARDQITEDRKAISDLQTDIDQLRTLIKAKARRTVLEPIVEDAEVRAQALAMSNRTTDHILTAKQLAIRNEAPLVPKA